MDNSNPIGALEKLASFLEPGGNQSAHLKPMDDIIQYGNYFTQLSPFIQVFGLDKIHFVDGGAIVQNPGPEFTEIEHFFGFENELEFKFNQTKGFPCLSRPVPFCLPGSKGRTRGTNTPNKHPDDLVPEKMTAIRNFYRAEMENVFRLVHPDLDQKDFCREPDLYRFAWLKQFLCSVIIR